MVSPLRLEFPNALYHITSCDDRREKIYEDDEDRGIFLGILGKVVTNYNWLYLSFCLVLEEVGQKLNIWSGLKGQIYLSNEKFVSTMQNKIEKNGNDWSIPKKQKRPIAKTLLQIEKQYQDRNLAIVVDYNTAAYSQREISEHCGLHLSTVGVIVRRFKNSQFGTCPLFLLFTFSQVHVFHIYVNFLIFG